MKLESSYSNSTFFWKIRKKIKLSKIDNNDINECLETIRRQVNEIGYLVDEFSNFARLPNPKLEKTNIIHVINDVVNDYKSNYKV